LDKTPQSSGNKSKIDSCDYFKLKLFKIRKESIEWRDNIRKGRKHLQCILLTRDWYPNYLRNPKTQ
jgi:hypothetical protein